MAIRTTRPLEKPHECRRNIPLNLKRPSNRLVSRNAFLHLSVGYTDSRPFGTDCRVPVKRGFGKLTGFARWEAGKLLKTRLFGKVDLRGVHPAISIWNLEYSAGRPLQEVDGRGFPALRSEQALQLLSGPQSGLRPRSPPWPDASGQRLHPCHRPRSSR
jgi:hypothetical protein